MNNENKLKADLVGTPELEAAVSQLDSLPTNLRVNTPYVNVKDENGDPVNPITKDRSFRNIFPNRRARRSMANQTMKNNSKGTRMVVMKIGPMEFFKSQIRFQRMPGKTILHYS